MRFTTIPALQLNVAQLLREPIGATRAYGFESVSSSMADEREHMVSGRASFLRTHQSLLASVDAETEMEVCCCRCLENFIHRARLSFEDEFFPTVDVLSGAPLAVPADAFAIDPHHILDLGAAIREYVMLDVPMKPLCNANCRGICQSCGKNLNKGDCGCSGKAADTRLASLENLLQQTKFRE